MATVAHPPIRSGETGVSLIIVLLILVVVSLLGAGAAQLALTAERTTRADRDYQIAFQSAEAALADAVTDMQGPNTSANQRLATFVSGNKQGFVANCGTGTTTRGLCLPNTQASSKDVWYQVDFTDQSATAPTVAYGTYTGRTMNVGSKGLEPARLPRYIIEVLDHTEAGMDASSGASKVTIYRVTAMGFGPNVNARVMLQQEYQNQSGL